MPQSIGSPPAEDIFITFIRGLGRARAIREVINVTDLVLRYDHTPSVKILNSILEDIDLAREFFRKNIVGSGFEVDIYTFGILMKGLCLTNRIADAFQLLQVMKSHALVPNTVIYNTLLHALCKNSKTGRARGLMNKMLQPNQVTFNILISGYCQEQNLVQASVMLEKCFHLGFLPDIRVVTKLLEALCTAGRLDEAFEIFQRVDERGGVVDVVAYNTLIKGFCKSGKTKAAHRLLKEMEAKGCLPNVETYNLLISGFCEQGLLDSALCLFMDMKMDGINYNFITYDALIRALCSNGRTDDGFRILEIMEDNGGSKYRISPYYSIIYGLYSENHWEEALDFLEKLGRMFPRVVNKSLRILNFCKEENMGDALWVYQQMIDEGCTSNALVYSDMIAGFCKQGHLREAFDLANEMVSSGYFPAASTVNSIVRGFCRQGHAGSAVNLLEDLASRGWMLDERSYSPVISELCKRGDIDKAFSVLVGMIENKISPDCFIWTSMLSAFVLFEKRDTNPDRSLLQSFMGSE